MAAVRIRTKVATPAEVETPQEVVTPAEVVAAMTTT
jgi:hypothetical protein